MACPAPTPTPWPWLQSTMHGSTGEYLSVGEHAVFYTQSYEYMNEPFTTIPGEQEIYLH